MAEKLTFEQSMQRLEQIAATLERGEAGLEESMQLYAQAAKLIASCRKKLDAVQLRMEQLHAEPQPLQPAEEEEHEGI